MFEELLLVERPELADILVRLEGPIDEFPVRFLDAPNIKVADDIAEMIEPCSEHLR
jgi:hypothetical protein